MSDTDDRISGRVVDTGDGTIPFYETRMLDISEIDPNPWNPNEMDERTFNRLVKEIRDVGFLDAVQVVPYTTEDGRERFRLLGGEHRWRAAGVIGLKQVKAEILEGNKFKDEKTQKAVTVRLNALKGRLNRDKIVRLFQEFAEEHSAEAIQDLFAMTNKEEWSKLVRDTRRSLQKSGMSPEMMAEFDKNVKQARTVDDLSKIVQRMYEMYGDTVPFGFMVMTWGKKEHIYVAMTSKTKTAMDKLLKLCKERQVEINQVLAPVLEDALDELKAESERVSSDSDDGIDD